MTTPAGFPPASPSEKAANRWTFIMAPPAWLHRPGAVRERDLQHDRALLGPERPVDLEGAPARIMARFQPEVESGVVEASADDEDLLRIGVALRPERRGVRPGAMRNFGRWIFRFD
jgi:hypothetical protein